MIRYKKDEGIETLLIKVIYKGDLARFFPIVKLLSYEATQIHCSCSAKTIDKCFNFNLIYDAKMPFTVNLLRSQKLIGHKFNNRSGYIVYQVN